MLAKILIISDKDKIKDVAGILTSCAKKPNTDDFNVLRQQAWDQTIEEKFGKDTINSILPVLLSRK